MSVLSFLDVVGWRWSRSGTLFSQPCQTYTFTAISVSLQPYYCSVLYPSTATTVFTALLSKRGLHIMAEVTYQDLRVSSTVLVTT